MKGWPHSPGRHLTSPWRRVLGEGLKKLCRTESSVLKSALSFSRIYCFNSGETSSPKRAWLSCQICLFTSTAHARYNSLSAITSFSFFSGTYTVNTTAPCKPCLCRQVSLHEGSAAHRPYRAQPMMDLQLLAGEFRHPEYPQSSSHERPTLHFKG